MHNTAVYEPITFEEIVIIMINTDIGCILSDLQNIFTYQIGQIMIKMGMCHAHNNKRLPLVELRRYNEFA